MGSYFGEKILTCNCCVQDLSKLICINFNEGDIIGLTFIDQSVAAIATGTFVKIEGSVVIVKDLFIEGTVSFVALCDVNSVEKGISAVNANNKPISISLAK